MNVQFEPIVGMDRGNGFAVGKLPKSSMLVGLYEFGTNLPTYLPMYHAEVSEFPLTTFGEDDCHLAATKYINEQGIVHLVMT